MTPHALDLTIGVLIFLSTLIAYFRGIVRELFTLAGFALAAFVSYKGGHVLMPGVGKWLGVLPEGSHEKPDVLGLVTPTIGSYIISYGGIFLLIFVLMMVIRMLISHWIKEAGLSVVDRVLGASFGFLRGFLLVFVVYATCFYLVTRDKFPDWAKNSYSVPVLDSTMAWTNNHIDLNKIIEDRGNGIAIKLDKVDLDKLGAEAGDAAKELKDEVKKEETDVQKGLPVVTPPTSMPTPGGPMPGPMVPAPAPSPVIPASAPVPPPPAASPMPGATSSP